MDKEDVKPWIEKRFGRWEVNTSCESGILVNCGVNETIEIDKLYGPLAAHGVRVRLEYKDNKADWVVESEDLANEKWIERARWYCQDNWPKAEEKEDK